MEGCPLSDRSMQESWNPNNHVIQNKTKLAEGGNWHLIAVQIE